MPSDPAALTSSNKRAKVTLPRFKKKVEEEHEDAAGAEEKQRMDWVGALLEGTKRLDFESKVRRAGRGSGMVILPGAWIGRKVKISVELLD